MSNLNYELNIPVEDVFGSAMQMSDQANTVGSPVWWAVRLAKKLAESSRSSSTVSKLERYYQGDADLPFVPDPTKQAFQRFQKKSRTNFASLIINAITDRVSLAGWSTSRQEETDDYDSEAWQRWVDSGMELIESELISTSLRLGESYALAGKTASGKTKVSVESPLTMAAERDNDGEVIAAGKYELDDIEQVTRFYVYLPGETYIFETPFKNKRASQVNLTSRNVRSWRVSDSSFATGLDYVPVFVLENFEGQGEYEKHFDLLDRINEGVLNRITITTHQAHRSRMFTQKNDEDGDAPLQQFDEEGNENDYSSMIPSSPGEIGILPPGVDVWESTQTEVQGIINAVKGDVLDLAAVTTTLVYYLLPDSVNTSASATDQGSEAFFFKIKDRQKRFKQPFANILKALYDLDGEEAPERATAVFANPKMQSLTQIGQAWSQITGLPLEAKLELIWGLPPSKISSIVQQADAARLEELAFGLGNNENQGA